MKWRHFHLHARRVTVQRNSRSLLSGRAPRVVQCLLKVIYDLLCFFVSAVAASAPRKSLGASGSVNAHSSGAQSGTPAKSKYAGGNPVCPRPTPPWQKGIGDFFGGPSRKPEKENLHPVSDDDDAEAGGSGVTKAPRKSRPIIDDEEEE
uniref:PCNA-associated factor n=1 Tax=Cyprinus carpio TaxID=7962 RepID=A0A8C2I4B0_CYPCA